MTVFSFTAPQISDDEETAERLQLSEDERNQVLADLFGPSELTETREQVETADERLRLALDDIPDNDKAVYLEALRRSPDVVRHECPALMFLRCENHNEKAAAKRLVEYWKARLRFFGKDRAYLPMTLTGAMKEDAQHVLHGFISVLPEDRHGRVVVFWDRIRMAEPLVTRDQAYRIAFFTTQKIAMSETAQRHGTVVLMNFEGFDLYIHMDRIRTKTFAHLLTHWAPMRVRSHHIFCGRSSAVLELALPVLKFLYGKYLRLRMVLHGGQNRDYQASASRYGIVADNLNDCSFGGGFNHDKFIEWLSGHEGKDTVASVIAQNRR